MQLHFEPNQALLDHFRAARAMHSAEVRPVSFVDVRPGAERELEQVLCACRAPWARTGSGKWTVRADVGDFEISLEVDDQAYVGLESVPDFYASTSVRAAAMRRLLQINWQFAYEPARPRFEIDPTRGIGVIRAVASDAWPVDGLRVRLAEILMAYLELIRLGRDECGASVATEEFEAETASDASAEAPEPGFDELLQQAREDHGFQPVEAGTGHERDPAGLLAAVINDNEIPWARESDTRWTLHSDAGSIHVALYPDYVLMLGNAPDPQDEAGLRALLRLNSKEALGSGVRVALPEDGDGEVQIATLVDMHELHCMYSPQRVLENSVLRLMRVHAKAASAVAGEADHEDALRGGAAPSLEETLAELDGLIGLAPVKRQVREVMSLLRVQQRRAELGHRGRKGSHHLVFTGPPGTGKTTVARLVGQIYRACGLLETGQLVAVARKDLVAEYIGQTAVKTNRVINRAMGGVLFIDEAYSLSPEDPARDFGREAIDTLLARMEDDRDKLVVIVAGYPGEMTRFLSANPGLESRFPTTIDFPDYSPSELMKILDVFACEYDYVLTPDARVEAARRIQESYASRTERFGNARMVRNLIEEATRRHAARLAGDGSLEGDDEALAVLDGVDFGRVPRESSPPPIRVDFVG